MDTEIRFEMDADEYEAMEEARQNERELMDR